MDISDEILRTWYQIHKDSERKVLYQCVTMYNLNSLTFLNHDNIEYRKCHVECKDIQVMGDLKWVD